MHNARERCRPHQKNNAVAAALLKLLSGRSAMELAVGLGFMFAIWIAVLWGSNYFNRNVQ